MLRSPWRDGAGRSLGRSRAQVNRDPWCDGYARFLAALDALARSLGDLVPGDRGKKAGCTDAEVAAITGQSRQMIEHYARLVNQTKLARKAISKWENGS